MAHWAELDSDNKVIRITVGDNNDPAGDEGYQWLLDNLGGTWIKCSYNGTIRNKYPAIGDSYLEDLDAFIEPKPFQSWSLNTVTLKWDAPIPMPTDGARYNWYESEQTWKVSSEANPL